MASKSLESLKTTLTLGQRQAFDKAMSGRNLFITGGGGVGKSYLLDRITIGLKRIGKKNIIICAPTGIAASNINHATTINKAFRIPPECCVQNNQFYISSAKLLNFVDVVIIDEISMCRLDVFDSIVASLRRVEEDSGNRKKIQLIVTGDFYQLPPVFSNDEEYEYLKNFYGKDIKMGYAFQGFYWDSCNFYVANMEEVVRQKDPEFIDHLNKIREGDKTDFAYFNKVTAQQINENAVRLFPRNEDVRAENLAKLSELEGEAVFLEPKGISEEKIKKVPEGEWADAQLTLKLGAKVMFTMNAVEDCYEIISRDTTSKVSKDAMAYANGTFGTIRQINIDSPYWQDNYITVGTEQGLLIKLKRHKFSIYEYSVETSKITCESNLKCHKIAEYQQFPVKLAYAATIHKAQGKTFDYISIDPKCYNAGQLYVALSRARDVSKIYLLEKIKQSEIRTDEAVKEFYRDILEDDKTDYLSEKNEGERNGENALPA